MRVLHGYSGNLYGGVETLLATLARLPRLAPAWSRGSPSASTAGWPTSCAAAGAAVRPLGPARFSRPWTVWRAAATAAPASSAAARPDAVVCHSLLAARPLRPRSPTRGGRWPSGCTTLVEAGPLDRPAGGADTAPTWSIVNSRSTAETPAGVFPGGPGRGAQLPAPCPPPAGRPGRPCATVRRELETPDDAAVIVQASRLERVEGAARC